MYPHCWLGCNKKKESVCISHPEGHTPPTVVTSCTACGGDKAFIITTQNHCTEKPTIKFTGKILFILLNLNLCINLIICQFLSTCLYKKKGPGLTWSKRPKAEFDVLKITPALPLIVCLNRDVAGWSVFLWVSGVIVTFSSEAGDDLFRNPLRYLLPASPQRQEVQKFGTETAAAAAAANVVHSVTCFHPGGVSTMYSKTR